MWRVLGLWLITHLSAIVRSMDWYRDSLDLLPGSMSNPCTSQGSARTMSTRSSVASSDHLARVVAGPGPHPLKTLQIRAIRFDHHWLLWDSDVCKSYTPTTKPWGPANDQLFKDYKGLQPGILRSLIPLFTGDRDLDLCVCKRGTPMYWLHNVSIDFWQL